MCLTPEDGLSLLLVAPEVPGVTRAHVCALKVSLEDPNQVVLVMDLCRWKVLELGLGGVGWEQEQVANDEFVIICTS